jgi:hypothetical protein
MITIKHRCTNDTILTVDADTLTRADLSRTNLYRADLRWANLYRADLRWADLYRADLYRADLTGADLTGANLTGANLTGADLTGADLTGADLTGADLYRANLIGADLYRANLIGADLTGADLTGADLNEADLSEADLSAIRDDVLALLATAPHEVEGLRHVLVDGRVNGLLYEGDCSCLVGTIAKIKGCNYELLSPNSNRQAERWALAIQPGHTPANSQIVAITVGWIDEFIKMSS